MILDLINKNNERKELLNERKELLENNENLLKQQEEHNNERKELLEHNDKLLHEQEDLRGDCRGVVRFTTSFDSRRYVMYKVSTVLY